MIHTSDTQDEKRITINEVVCLITVLFLFFLLLVVFSLRWAKPDSSNSYNDDLMFWMGNIIALKDRFLPLDFRTLQEGYKYHYLGSMHTAVMSLTTDIPVFNLVIRYGFIESVVLMGLSANCILSRVIKHYKIVVISLILLFLSTGIEEKSVVTWIWHIYLCPMSFDISISFEMIIMLLIFIQNRTRKMCYKITVLVALCLVVCTGTKGPAGAVTLVGIGIICIYWMVKKDYEKSFIYGILSLAAFGTIYFALLRVGNNQYMANAVSTVSDEIVSKSVIEYFKYVILTDPWTVIPTILFSAYNVLKRKINIERLAMFTMIIVGTVLGYVVVYYGASQMYFTLAVMPWMAILAGCGCDIVYSRWLKDIKSNKLLEIIMIAMFATIVFTCSMINDYHSDFSDHLKLGIEKLTKINFDVSSWYRYISNDEYLTYVWIRDNTENDDVVLSDSYLATESFDYFPGVFSERYIFAYNNENMDLGMLCYEGDEAALEALISQGIDYIVNNKNDFPNFVMPESLGELAFEKGEMVVYKVYSKDDI